MIGNGQVWDGAVALQAAQGAKPVLNGMFMSGLIIAIAGFASGWSLWRAKVGQLAAQATA